MAIQGIATGLEDEFYTHIDRVEHPDLARAFDALMGDLDAILKRYQRRVVTDGDCNVIRRLDRWGRPSTHTGWCPSDAATWAIGVSTSSA